MSPGYSPARVTTGNRQATGMPNPNTNNNSLQATYNRTQATGAGAGANTTVNPNNPNNQATGMPNPYTNTQVLAPPNTTNTPSNNPIQNTLNTITRYDPATHQFFNASNRPVYSLAEFRTALQPNSNYMQGVSIPQWIQDLVRNSPTTSPVLQAAINQGFSGNILNNYSATPNAVNVNPLTGPSSPINPNLLIGSGGGSLVTPSPLTGNINVPSLNTSNLTTLLTGSPPSPPPPNTTNTNTNNTNTNTNSNATINALTQLINSFVSRLQSPTNTNTQQTNTQTNANANNNQQNQAQLLLDLFSQPQYQQQQGQNQNFNNINTFLRNNPNILLALLLGGGTNTATSVNRPPNTNNSLYSLIRAFLPS